MSCRLSLALSAVSSFVESTKNRGTGWVSCRLKGCQNLYPAQRQLLMPASPPMEKGASNSDFNWW